MSTLQVIPTVQVFDYEYAAGSSTLTNPLPAVGVKIQAQLAFNVVNAISPVSNIQALTISVVTDNNGQWQMNLIPNTNINPANTVWTITTPTKRYDISVPSSGPVQSSTIQVSAPSSLAPGAVTTGALTVTGLLTAQAGEIVSGGLTVATGGLTVSAGGASITGAFTTSDGVTVGGALTHSTQSIAFASTITPAASAGEVITVGALTANITVANATSPAAGQVLTFIFTQDGTGGRTITWGAAYKTAWQPVAAASSISTVSFVYDGTNWQQLANATPTNNTGAVSVVGILTAGAHVLATGATPSLGSLQTGIASQSITGNDTRGRVVATTSGSPPAVNSPVAVVTFASAFAAAPVVTVADQGGTAVTASFTARSVGTGGFTIFNSGGGNTLAGTTAYTIGYHVIG
jgi:hypothetical protein